MKTLFSLAVPLCALAPVTAQAAAPAATAAVAAAFDCMIEPMQTVEIRSPAAGLLQEVHARRGETVRRGQVLVTVESSVERSAAESAHFRAEAQGARLTARNKVEAARAKAKRLTELADEEFVSAQARDDATAELRVAESELQVADENAQMAKLEHRQAVDTLNRRVVRSPFDGVVIDQYLHAGALVDGGEGRKPILKIAQTRPLAVQAILPFQRFPDVKPGGAVTVVPEAPFGREIRAHIRTVDRVIDSAAGTFGVVAEIDNAKQELPAGIRCKLLLSTGTTKQR